MILDKILYNINKVNTFSYEAYKNLVLKCADEGTTTGNEMLPERVEATKINAQRMKRIDKQVQLGSSIISALSKVNSKWTWMLISEAWCGDGAQNIPIIAKIAEASPNIELKIVLRDENLEIMDNYLTNGSRSMPKLICIKPDTKQELGVWGPRPAIIQEMVKEYKKNKPDVSHEEFVRHLHLWYAKDKGETLLNEFEQLIVHWSSL